MLIDDEPNLRKVLIALLEQQGYEVRAEPDGASGLHRVRTSPPGTFDAIITDLRMPGMGGMEVLRTVARERPKLPVIVLTAHGSVDTAVEAVKAGAFDFLEKPFDRDQIHQVVAKAVATRRLRGPTPPTPSPAATPESVDDPSLRVGMIGQSSAITRVREIVRKVAGSPSTVLITGDSGTGKELVARALHLGSSDPTKPFISVNCAAIPAGLVESELFGHERGAFTGAVSSRAGRFELADGGTLFLDEISEIPLEIQVKLLRAIQESEFERVGGMKTVRVNVRLIAATNRDLAAEIANNRFRDDLYYRLNVVPISLPALHQRPEDIPLLVDHFVARCNDRLGKSVAGFTDDALAVLCAYTWPGNIRELENLIERMVLFASEDRVTVDELPDSVSCANRTADTTADGGEAGTSDERHVRLPLSSLGLDLKEAVKAGSRLVEESLIREALRQTDSNVTRSARLLGISRRSLQSKMKELGLREPPDNG
ncbi:MAG: sigma-54-dependent Fis family transcriptional regulator [Myxococcales bacterium FL481]|nr:MAG: sigma-54-dependent Fis family transcriptional regulator [Myxococcales bacterium FL481]